MLIGSSIRAESFFQLQTLAIMGIGLFAFIMNIAGRHFGRQGDAYCRFAALIPP